MTPEEIVERAAEVLAEAGVAHAQLRRHYAEKLADAGLLPTEVEQRHRCDNVTDWVQDEGSWLSKNCESGSPETQCRYVTPWREVTS